MKQTIKLNQQVEYRSDIETAQTSYTSESRLSKNTLDEPVTTTIYRDLMIILKKVTSTLSGNGDFEKDMRQWDLWGPSIITLFTAGLVAFSSDGDAQQLFTTLIFTFWIGPLIISLNFRLLGSKVVIIQSLCLIIYCSSPILVLAIVTFILNMTLHMFWIKVLFGIGALAFTMRMNACYFKKLIDNEHVNLSLYPMFLFYAFMCTFIALS